MIDFKIFISYILILNYGEMPAEICQKWYSPILHHFHTSRMVGVIPKAMKIDTKMNLMWYMGMILSRHPSTISIYKKEKEIPAFLAKYLSREAKKKVSWRTRIKGRIDNMLLNMKGKG